MFRQAYPDSLSADCPMFIDSFVRLGTTASTHFFDFRNGFIIWMWVYPYCFLVSRMFSLLSLEIIFNKNVQLLGYWLDESTCICDAELECYFSTTFIFARQIECQNGYSQCQTECFRVVRVGRKLPKRPTTTYRFSRSSPYVAECTAYVAVSTDYSTDQSPQTVISLTEHYELHKLRIVLSALTTT